VSLATTVVVSAVAVAAGNVKLTATVVVAPTLDAPSVPTVIAVASRSAALTGATEVRTPKPIEATATSATRLKVVFVDICFLSISQDQEFPGLGFELIS
jgi:hypothetical protein